MNNIFAVAGIVIKELYRRKDFYVLFILTIVICLVMASVNIFNDNQIIRYLKELCLLLIWISSLVIAITTTARQIPAEREQRTLLPLLAKPLSRTQLIFGKFLGCWLACGLVLVCFYAFFGALAASREHAWPLLNYFQAAFLHWVMLGVVIALTLLGSLVFAAPSSNSTICFVVVAAILCVGRYLDIVALSLSEPARSIVYAIYFAIPHLEWAFEMRNLIVHDWPLIEWKFFGLDALYLAGLRGGFSGRRLPGFPPQGRQLKNESGADIFFAADRAAGFLLRPRREFGSRNFKPWKTAAANRTIFSACCSATAAAFLRTAFSSRPTPIITAAITRRFSTTTKLSKRRTWPRTPAPLPATIKAKKTGFMGPPRDWIDAFGRHFIPNRHTHLDEGGATDDLSGSKEVREILPWLKLSAELDPENVKTYIRHRVLVAHQTEPGFRSRTGVARRLAEQPERPATAF